MLQLFVLRSCRNHWACHSPRLEPSSGHEGSLETSGDSYTWSAVTKRQLGRLSCLPSGLMDTDTPPSTPRTRARTRRSAGRRWLHFHMMMSAFKVSDGRRWRFGPRLGRVSPKKQGYPLQRPVNATCPPQQREVHEPALSFPIQNTDHQKDEKKDGWHVAMPTPLNFLMAVPWTPTHECCRLGKMETDIYPTCRHWKGTWKKIEDWHCEINPSGDYYTVSMVIKFANIISLSVICSVNVTVDWRGLRTSCCFRKPGIQSTLSEVLCCMRVIPLSFLDALLTNLHGWIRCFSQTPALRFSFPVKSYINYKLYRPWFALFKTHIRWFSSPWEENNKRTDGHSKTGVMKMIIDPSCSQMRLVWDFTQ